MPVNEDTEALIVAVFAGTLTEAVAVSRPSEIVVLVVGPSREAVGPIVRVLDGAAPLAVRTTESDLDCGHVMLILAVLKDKDFVLGRTYPGQLVRWGPNDTVEYHDAAAAGEVGNETQFHHSHIA